MPECQNPLCPCAMTGAVACLAGFEGITVVIHGSSGCYFYPATLLPVELSGTFILENEVIFGAEERLRTVIDAAAQAGNRVAVVTTCVPAIMGEDIRAMVPGRDVILIDSPGFAGSFRTGYQNALSVLSPEIDCQTPGVNIDGVCLLDPFYRGNVLELTRMLSRSNVPVATVLCADSLRKIRKMSPVTITVDPDLASGTGTCAGQTLGLDALQETFLRIGDLVSTADPAPVMEEIAHAGERIALACDKYLRRFDPPRVAIFAGFSAAAFVAGTLKKYLDAEICCIGSRTEVPDHPAFPAVMAPDLSRVSDLIGQHHPDLVIGSSFERSVKGSAAFVGLTAPLRGRVRLASRPLAGIEGTLFLIEEVLNACMDGHPPRP